MKRRMISTILAATCLLVGSNVVSAETATVTGQLTGGQRSITVGDTDLGSVTYSAQGPAFVGSDTALSINDESASGEGWTVSISVSDFTATLPDRTNTQTGSTFVAAIPASSVKMKVWYLGKSSGQDVDPVNGPMNVIAQDTPLSNTPRMAFKANPGFGMGSYSASLNYQLIFPEQVKVTTLSNSGTSKLTVGGTTGLQAATYTGTFVYDLGVGI